MLFTEHRTGCSNYETYQKRMDKRCRDFVQLWDVLVVLLLCIAQGHTASASCTIVRSVRVVSGGTAELLCQINHERNDPSKTTYYRKTWIRKVKTGANRNVYVYIKSEKVNKDEAVYVTKPDGTIEYDYRGRAVRTSNDVVKLRNVTQQDDGTYSCNWEVEPDITGCQDAKTEFTVTLIDPVSDIKSNVTSPKKEGEIATFHCSASGTSPITYTWQKVDGVIATKRWTDHGDGSATLRNIQRADAGEYRCTADNEAKKPQTSNVVLEVYYAPNAVNLTSIPSNHTQQENTQVTLTCIADGGHPDPNVTIYRNGVKTAQGTSIVTLNRRLHRSDHQVAYVCRTTNPGINSNEIKYDVLFDPDGVIINPPNPNVDVDNDVTLTCRTNNSSNPPVSLTWTQGGSTVTDGVTHGQESGSHNANVSMSQLTFKAQKENNSNVYVCKVTTLLNLTDQTTLNVMFPPSTNNETESPPGSVPIGNNKSLTCTTDSANPSAEITWIRNGKTITDHVMTNHPDGLYNANKTTSSITIHTAKDDNGIVYTCIVKHKTNNISRLTKKFKLDVTFNATGVNITNPPITNVDVDTNVTLTCKTTTSSNPPVSLTWTRNGSTVTDGVTHGQEPGNHNANVSTSQLRFKAQKVNNGNVYMCKMTTHPQLNDEITLNVLFPPSLNNEQESPQGSVAVGDQKFLTCTTDSANPPAEIIWMRDGKNVTDHAVTTNPIGDNNAKKTKSTINVMTAKHHNGNQYTCIVEHKTHVINNLTKIIKLNVTFNPDGVKITNSPHPSVGINTNVTLMCKTNSSSNPPVSLSWTRDGSTVTDGVTHGQESGEHNATVSTSQLRFITKKENNGNVYLCKVTQLTDQTTLNVTFPPDQVNVSESPSGPVRFGNSKNLTCSTDSANPAAQITWTRNNVTVTDSVTEDNTNGQYKAFIITSTVTIQTTKAHNENVYKCTISHMNHEVPSLDKPSFCLNVTFPHGVNISASSNPVVEGKDTTLTCLARGGNPVTVDSYEWQSPYPVTTTSSMIGSSRELTLTNTSYKHVGKYSCSVTNMGGEGSGSTDLEVLYSAKLDPRVVHTQKITAEYNQTVTFELNVIANPLPSYNWSRSYNDTEMPLLKKSIVETKGLTSNLTIPMTQKEDMISYICRVNNSVNLEEFNFALIPAAPPDQPSELRTRYESAVSVTLTWIAGFNGGFTQVFVLMYRIAGQPWPQHPQIMGIPDPGENKAVMYKVQNLTENTAYEFRVRAENERQNGQRTSQYTEITQGKTKAKPTVTGNKLTVLRRAKSTVATANWSKPRGHYTDINIKYCEKPDGACHQHIVNISVSTTRTEIRSLDANMLYTYVLQLYDNGDLIYSTAAAHGSSPVSPTNTSGLIGGLVGTLSAIIIIAIVVALMVVYKRQHPGKPKKKKVPTATLR